MQGVNPSHPDLKVLIDKGADAGLFAEVARECVSRGKPFHYALAVIKGRMRDAAALADTVLSKPAAMTARNHAGQHKYASAAAAIFDMDEPTNNSGVIDV